MLEDQLPAKDFLRFQQIAMYQENAFSPAATGQSIQAAEVRVLQYLVACCEAGAIERCCCPVN